MQNFESPKIEGLTFCAPESALCQLKSVLLNRALNSLILRVCFFYVLLLQSVSRFSGTSLPKLSWHTKPCTKRHTEKGGVARAAKAAKVAVEKSCNVGDHVLDNFSNYIFHQIQRPFAKYIPDNWDPLDFLPVNIQSSLQKSEALVSACCRSLLFCTIV